MNIGTRLKISNLGDKNRKTFFGKSTVNLEIFQKPFDISEKPKLVVVFVLSNIWTIENLIVECSAEDNIICINGVF